jgi:hypothetical protein
MDSILDNLAFGLIIFALLMLLILGAGALSSAHSDEREACIKAGYEWSATKYACTVNLKK